MLLYLIACCSGRPKNVPGYVEDRQTKPAVFQETGPDRSSEYTTSAKERDFYHLSSGERPLVSIEPNNKRRYFVDDHPSSTAPERPSNEDLNREDVPRLEENFAIACYQRQPWLRRIDADSCQPVFSRLAAMAFRPFVFRNHEKIHFPATDCELRITDHDESVGNCSVSPLTRWAHKSRKY